jgi:para-nitrobenzyl esterase
METIDVQVAQGVLRGERLADHAVFRNVPFAAPPVEANRFRPPQPVPAWDGVRDATGPTVGVPQPVVTLPGADAPPNVHMAAEQGDDCLVLRIHTPDVRGGGLPVMVWIHGGGFIGGSGGSTLFDGSTFARDGIVHVGINYRLHLDGFLYLGPGTANLGLRDQIAALQWVQDNIEAFGGDPGNVTIYGQSAGGVSVQTLVTMPLARGLFRRAISNSGSSAITAEVETAERLTRRFAEMLGCEATVDGFSAVDQDEVLAAVLGYALEYLVPALWGDLSFTVSPFRPVLDGEVVPEHPAVAAADGAGAEVQLMAGTTRDECTFAMAPFGLLSELNEPWADAALQAFGLTWDDLDAYRKGSRPHADRVELVMAAWTDWAFRIPSIRLVEARRRHDGPATDHLYELTWPSPTQPEIRSSHSLDLPFVFGQARAAHELVPPAFDVVGPDAPLELERAMHRAWVGFATSGDPGWAPYDLERRTTMRFDAESGPVDDLAGPVERELWEGRR